MPNIWAVDPGPKESALVVLCGTVVADHRKLENRELLGLFRGLPESQDRCVIEMLAGSYGQAVGIEVMETAVMVGELKEAWRWTHRLYAPADLMFRKTAVSHVTGNPRANDSHVRQALIDRWGGDSAALRKKVRCSACNGRGSTRGETCRVCGGEKRVGWEGPLLGVTKDCWAALALAVTLQDGEYP